MSESLIETLQMGFYILVLVGILLICAEVVIPGGVIGVIGGIALIAAIVIAFLVYSVQTAMLIAVGILLLLGICIILWVKFFPKSGIGKKMMLSDDGKDFKASERGLADLLDMEGEATADLRPAGYAVIDGRRVDVVTEGGMIEKGSRIHVIEIEGNRVVVRKIAD